VLPPVGFVLGRFAIARTALFLATANVFGLRCLFLFMLVPGSFRHTTILRLRHMYNYTRSAQSCSTPSIECM